MEMNWPPIPNLLFGCAWYFLLESNDGIQFQILFGCTNREIQSFVEFGQYKVVYMYGK